MFFKITYRNATDISQSTHYYRLVESYRDLKDTIRHRTLLNVGNLDQLSKQQFEEIRIELTNRTEGKFNLFAPSDELVKGYIEQFWQRLVQDKKVDISARNNPTRESCMKVSTMEHRAVREIGAEWLGHQAIKQLRIEDYLQSVGWEEEQIKLALTQIISRAVYPASELKTSKWIQENSGICELTQYPMDKMTKDKLYQSALALYKVKGGLEQHLSKRTNELFDLEDKIVLYDLTNTYFEGKKAKSELARYGRSKEKRSDSKIIVLAMVVNIEGFLKYSTVYEGNRADCETLPAMIDQLSQGSNESKSKALVVMDAGIATEENLKIVESKGYTYLCVHRSKLQDYTSAENTTEHIQYTQDGQALSLQQVKSDRHTDYFLKVKSPGKALKEKSMKSKFDSLFVEEMEKIKASITKKHGTKKTEKVNRRIGRAIQKYPSAAQNYDITSKANDQQMVIEITYSINEEKSKKKEDTLGVYFLRTNLTMKDEKTVWKAYNTIREIESTFRILKTELDLRPIYHKNDDATLAHLHLGLLGYWLVNTIRYQLKAKNIHSDWREITRIGNTQKVITTSGISSQNESIEIRKCSEPDPKLKDIYDVLQIKYMPLPTKKSVVHKPDVEKINPLTFSMLSG